MVITLRETRREPAGVWRATPGAPPRLSRAAPAAPVARSPSRVALRTKYRKNLRYGDCYDLAHRYGKYATTTRLNLFSAGPVSKLVKCEVQW